MTHPHDGTKPAADSRWEGAWLLICIGIIAAVAAYLALDFVELARYFPLMVAIACVLLVLSDLGVRATAGRRNAAEPDEGTDENGGAAQTAPEPVAVEPEAAGARGVGRYVAWLLGYLLAIGLLSLVVASGLFVAAFLRIEARIRWGICLFSAFLLMAIILYGGAVFNMRWPESIWDPFSSLV